MPTEVSVKNHGARSTIPSDFKIYYKAIIPKEVKAGIKLTV